MCPYVDKGTLQMGVVQNPELGVVLDGPSGARREAGGSESEKVMYAQSKHHGETEGGRGLHPPPQWL